MKKKIIANKKIKTFQIKYKCQFIVRLKVIKYKENSIYYLFF